MRPRLKRGVLSRELPDGESVVVTPAGERALVVNAVGSALCELCTGRWTAAEMAALIHEHFPDVDEARVRVDVEELLAKLFAADLIEDADACGEPPTVR